MIRIMRTKRRPKLRIRSAVDNSSSGSVSTGAAAAFVSAGSFAARRFVVLPILHGCGRVARRKGRRREEVWDECRGGFPRGIRRRYEHHKIEARQRAPLGLGLGTAFVGFVRENLSWVRVEFISAHRHLSKGRMLIEVGIIDQNRGRRSRIRSMKRGMHPLRPLIGIIRRMRRHKDRLDALR